MQKKKGVNRNNIKCQNRGLVLRAVATGRCTTRIGLSKYTGLSKMTITNIVAELISHELLEESVMEQNEGVGRNAIQLKVSPLAPKVVGLLITRNRCEAVLCDLGLHIIRRKKREHPTKETLTDIIYSLIDSVILDEKNVAGIGISCIGPIDIAKGKILAPLYFYGIENVPIVKMIEERYHVPVYFNNDNQSGIIAENLYGNGRGYNDILFVGIAEGVGCGIISDSSLYTNRNELTPELGHIGIDYTGNQCICGNRGCIESYIRTPVLLEKMVAATGKYYTYSQFCQIAEKTPEVDEIFLDVVEKLSFALISSQNILNPELILLGHDGIYWTEKYIKLLEEKVNQHKFSGRNYPVTIKKAWFGVDAQLLGAACNVILQMFTGDYLPDM